MEACKYLLSLNAQPCPPRVYRPVPLLVQPQDLVQKDNVMNEAPDFSRKSLSQINSAEAHEEAHNETTISHQDEKEETHSQPINSKFQIGIYTLQERQEKIRKYKMKIQKWRRGENKNKDRYILRSKIAKLKPRVGGKFAKKVPVSTSRARSRKFKN